MGHVHLGAGAAAGVHEELDDVLVFVLVLDLPAALVQGDVGLDGAGDELEHAAEHLEGEVAGGLGAGVEVLVEPAFGGHDEGAGLPDELLLLLALGPH